MAKISSYTSEESPTLDDYLLYLDMAGPSTKKISLANLARGLTSGQTGLGWVDVRAYGAVGDGVADDTTAIQTAINSLGNGGRIFFPVGTYLISSKITFSNLNNIYLFGTNWNSILKLKDNTNDRMFQFSSCTNMFIKDIKFDGNRTGQSSGDQDQHHTIMFLGSSNITIENIYIISSVADSLNFSTNSGTANNWININNSKFEDFNRHGIALTHANDVFVSFNKFKRSNSTNDAGINTEPNPGEIPIFNHYYLYNLFEDAIISIAPPSGGGSNFHINGNKFIGETKDSDQYRIQCSGHFNDISISNNIIRADTRGGGILVRATTVDGSSRINIVNNILFNTESTDQLSEGIRVLGTSSTIISEINISENYVSGFGKIGDGFHIGTNQASMVKITNNIIKGNGTDSGAGIDAKFSNNIDINNNKVMNTNINGILTEGTNGYATSNIFIGWNTIFDNQGTPTQTYGIHIVDTGSNTDKIWIVGNRIRNAAGGIGQTGSPTNVYKNMNFVNLDGTKTPFNSGTGTISSGNTSVTITHGIDATPEAKDILINFTNNPSNDPGNFWIDTITSTQFNLNIRNNPGASGLNFIWHINHY